MHAFSSIHNPAIQSPARSLFRVLSSPIASHSSALMNGKCYLKQAKNSAVLFPKVKSTEWKGKVLKCNHLCLRSVVLAAEIAIKWRTLPFILYIKKKKIQIFLLLWFSKGKMGKCGIKIILMMMQWVKGKIVADTSIYIHSGKKKYFKTNK